MYHRIALDELKPREIDGIEPRLKAVEYGLRPEKMRPSVWLFEDGESNNRHRQREQEELYFVLDGRLKMEVDNEEFGIEAGEFLVISPDSWRQLTALEASTVLVVGTPNVKDNAIDETDMDR